MKKRREDTETGIVDRHQLAALLAVHPDTVSHFVARGMPVRHRGGRGRQSAYDAAACLDWQRAQVRGTPSDRAKTRLLQTQATLNERRFARERATVIPRAELERQKDLFISLLLGVPRALRRRRAELGIGSSPAFEKLMKELEADIRGSWPKGEVSHGR